MNNEHYWAVMKVYSMTQSMTAAGRPVKPENDGQPTHFIPLFETREKAVAWHGSEENIAEFEPVKNP